MRRKYQGFSLVELMVVVTIIIVLAGIAYPVTRNHLARAKQVNCLTKMRSIGIGLESYLQDNNRRMPEMATARPTKDANIPVLETVLLPYLQDPEAFHCPADNEEFKKTGSSYLWNSTQSGKLETELSFLNLEGKPQAIPLIADKEGWHPGQKNTNILYADLSASSDLRFITTP